MPRRANTGLLAHVIPLALLMFNVGVEIGLLYLISSVAMFWVIERLVAFGTTL